MLTLLNEFGLASFHGALRTAAKGNRVRDLEALGQKRVVDVGVPAIKVRKLWSRVEELVAQEPSVDLSM